MSAPDHVSSFIASHTNALHALLASPHRLHAWVVLSLEARTLVVLPTVEATPDDHEFPAAHRATFASELAKPRAEDELLAFFVEGEGMTVVRTDRARIARELAAPFVLDPRNHFPVPWPSRWRGPYALDQADTYRIDTPECQVLVRLDDAWDYGQLDDEGNPRHLWRLELGVTRAMDPVPPDDEQVASITGLFRHCGPWVDRTSEHTRRHPSRRIFSAEVDAHQQGTIPWPEVQPQEGMLGPPPGWEPLHAFNVRPLVFRIEGTELHVEWSPPVGANWFEAATGRGREPSRFTISRPGRRPTDEDARTVFAMLGGAAFAEEKSARPAQDAQEKGRRARVFLATAGWLRKTAGRG